MKTWHRESHPTISLQKTFSKNDVVGVCWAPCHWRRSSPFLHQTLALALTEEGEWHEMQIGEWGLRLEPGSGRYHTDGILVRVQRSLAPLTSALLQSVELMMTELRFASLSIEWWHYLVEWTSINGADIYIEMPLTKHDINFHLPFV